MSIGTLEIQTDSGWLEILLYEPGTFDYEPIEVQCANGWGVPALVPPGDADTPLEVYTSDGWYGINTEGAMTIDDFEHNALSRYYDIAQTSNLPDIRSSASRSGTYGLYGYADSRIMSLPPGHPNHSSDRQPDFLDIYPSSGDVFEFYFYVSGFRSGGTAINRFHFGKQDYTESDNGYRIWWSLNDDYWRLENYTGGSGDTLTDARLGSNWPTDEWIRGVVDWRGTGFSVTMYRENGSEIDTLSTNDSTYTSGGIGWDNGQYTISYTDDWQMVNP